MTGNHPHRPHRREFLGRSLIGTLGLAFSPLARRQLRAEGAPAPRATRCVVVWLNGGPSHIDTFDPKPGAPTNGPFTPIDTNIPGIQLCQHLPKLAQQAHRLAIVRSMTSNEADHERAYQFLHTGNMPQETVSYPALGAVLARRWSGEEGTLPSYVAINGGGAGPGFLGLDFAPYVIGDPSAPFANVAPPEGYPSTRLARRDRVLDALDRGFARRTEGTGAAGSARFTDRARRLMHSPSLQALDLAKEPAEVLARYGAAGDDTAFGRGCLLARRLLEQGVRFVEVTLDGWDTHADNFNQTSALMARLDPGLAALVADLDERGMLDETLVVCMGEFGRTPTINGTAGRDHWSQAFSAVLAGGGVRGGRVVGASDEKGESVKDRPVTVPDLFATLLTALGIDGTQPLRTPEGRPIKLVEGGSVVPELLD